MATQAQVLLLIYVILMLICRSILMDQRKTNRSLSAQLQSITKDPTALIGVVVQAVAIGMPVVEVTLREQMSLNIGSIISGIGLIIIGAGISYVANREIGTNWSPSIEKTEEQQLVTSGIYSRIRHPLYLSGLFIFSGTNLYFNSAWGWLGTILALIFIVFRIPREDRYLEERFREPYKRYRQQTKALLPWLL